MKAIFKVLLSIIFIQLLNNFSVLGQGDFVMIDSCGDANSAQGFGTISEYYIASTDSGVMHISRSKQFGATSWNYGAVGPAPITNHFSEYDSVGRIITRNTLVFDSAVWSFTTRTNFSYDSFGNMYDSTIQLFSNGTWTNKDDYTWQKDNSGNLLSSEHKTWNNNAWDYYSKQEWLYDSSNRDTLNIDYTGNGQTWMPNYKISYMYSGFGMTDRLYYVWDGTSWNYYSLQKTFYTGVNLDTLYLTLKWDSTQWDTTGMRITTYNSHYLKTSETYIDHPDSIWINHSRGFWNYDSNDTLLTYIYQLGDTSLWVNNALDSFTCTSPTQKYTFHKHWNQASLGWLCANWDEVDYTNPLYLQYYSGDLDATDCSILSSNSQSTYKYDSLGRLIQQYSYTFGNGSVTHDYSYDWEGFQYYSAVQGTQGGPFPITYYSGCHYYRPLLVMFYPNTIYACPGDSLHLKPYLTNSSRIAQYLWKSDTVQFQNPSPTFDGIVSNTSKWYHLTCYDSLGYYFSDSIFVQVHPDPSLGTDTVVCLPGSITLHPGSFPSYLWQDGSTDSSYSLTSTTPDTLLITVTVTDAACTNTDSVMVYFDNCIGIDPITDFKISVFPNPIHDGQEFRLVSDEIFSSLSVRSISGTLLYQSNKSGNDIILPRFSKGIYFLEILSAKNRFVKKLVVE